MTAELALALPSLMLVLTIGVWLQSAVALQARCLDAARAGARAGARGDPDGEIRARLAAALPGGASITIGHSGSEVSVVVTTIAAPPAGLASLVEGPTVTATALAVDEAAGDPVVTQ